MLHNARICTAVKAVPAGQGLSIIPRVLVLRAIVILHIIKRHYRKPETKGRWGLSPWSIQAVRRFFEWLYEERH